MCGQPALCATPFDTFDCCGLAFLHDALFGDGDATTVEGAGRDAEHEQVRSGLVPLHEAIARAARHEPSRSDAAAVQQASLEEVKASQSTDPCPSLS